ncbi:MAG: hypothetical protein ACRD6X_15065, partial [Pyrinomonadaceae bacterium]
MNRYLRNAVFSLLLVTLTIVICLGQKNGSTLTTEEKEAVEKLSEQFIQRLIDSGDIEPIINELFVTDFIQRLSAE